MLRACIILSLIAFASCNNDLKYYEQTVEKANKIEIHYRNSKDTIELTPQQTEAFKKNSNKKCNTEIPNEVFV